MFVGCALIFGPPGRLSQEIFNAFYMIEKEFSDVLYSICNDKKTVATYWLEIQLQYSKSSRHYHNLQHLNHLTQQLLPIKHLLQNWPVIVFAIAWHDIIYSATSKNNELKSAELAVKRLKAIQLNDENIKDCYDLIIATKAHSLSDNPDTNYFTDADLSILGSGADEYLIYTQQIRKEYNIYPTIVYNPGRKKVLQHFLSMHSIFKTDYFYNLYEKTARNNLQAELSRL